MWLRDILGAIDAYPSEFLFLVAAVWVVVGAFRPLRASYIKNFEVARKDKE
jgi:hypothetical protein